MNAIIKGIIERRSIRRYTDKSIDDDKIKQILTVAMYAPSGGDCRPWDFVVIKNKETLDKIAAEHSYASFLRDADCAIIVCGNVSDDKYKELWIQDCSAATQNILLASHGLELGSVWLTLYPDDNRPNEVREIIGAPQNVIPFAIVSLGYPAEEKDVPDRYEENKVHYENW